MKELKPMPHSAFLTFIISAVGTVLFWPTVEYLVLSFTQTENFFLEGIY